MVKYERPMLSTGRARAMRRDPTDAERKLWLLLRSRRLDGQSFVGRCQSAPTLRISFACVESLPWKPMVAKHVENQKDAMRDAWLVREGYSVVRYSNIDILKNPSGVLSDLLVRLKEQDR